MKKITAILVILLFFSCNTSSSDNKSENKMEVDTVAENFKTESSAESAVDNEDCNSSMDNKIKFIRDKFKIINEEQNYKLTESKNESDYSYESQTNYYKDKELRRISYELSADLSNIITDFYIWNNKLIFVYFKNEYQGENVSIHEERIYFCNEIAFKYINDKTTENSEQTEKAGKEYYSTYLEFLKKKK
jgi:hypothetical protein